MLRHLTASGSSPSIEEKLALAKRSAHEAVLSNADTVAEVRKITGKAGATAVFDFVGYQPTLDMAMGMVGVFGDVVIVGPGDGVAAAKVGFFSQPYEVSVRAPYWGTRSELIEVLDLARDGAAACAIETFSLDDGVEAYRRLAANDLRGRAVVVPDPAGRLRRRKSSARRGQVGPGRPSR